MLTLTFAEAKKQGACVESYKKFAAFKGGIRKWGMDNPFPLLEVLNNNGLDDALWALRYCEPKAKRDRIARLFACDCAQIVLPLFERDNPDDKRPRQAIDVARKFASGDATQAELDAARAAAWDAARAAAWDAARDAARAAAWDAARDAAWDAAWDAAREVQAQMLRQYLEG